MAIYVYERQCLWLGLICIILEIAFERANDVYVKQCLWLRLICTIIEKSPLRWLLYQYRKIAFERAADVRKKQCLWLGFICTTIEKSLLIGLLSCMWKQCLWLGLTYTTLEKMPLKGLMYDSGNCIWEGCWCVQETMPMGKTYMYNSRCHH